MRGEWDIVVLSPHFAAALLARDLGDEGPDSSRTFEFALTYDRETVARAAQALLGRVVPQLAPPRGATPLSGPSPAASPAGPAVPAAAAADTLLRRALAATTNGVTIADVTRPDHPLVYVNTAFERLSGFRAEEVLGRNCRFLQDETTDPAVVARIRDAIAEGRECRETLLNLRGPDRTPWWNEIYLAPVFDDTGRVLQYIGVQHDVTARVAAEEALVQARDTAERYAQRIEQLAFTDSLTGLGNRRSVTADLRRRLSHRDVGALIYLDLDGFKGVNDTSGHAGGDAVLVAVAERLRAVVGDRDTVARLGGDEFLVVLSDRPSEDLRRQAVRIVRRHHVRDARAGPDRLRSGAGRHQRRRQRLPGRRDRLRHAARPRRRGDVRAQARPAHPRAPAAAPRRLTGGGRPTREGSSSGPRASADA